MLKEIGGRSLFVLFKFFPYLVLEKKENAEQDTEGQQYPLHFDPENDNQVDQDGKGKADPGRTAEGKHEGHDQDRKNNKGKEPGCPGVAPVKRKSDKYRDEKCQDGSIRRMIIIKWFHDPVSALFRKTP